jgi:hypothetical protein
VQVAWGLALLVSFLPTNFLMRAKSFRDPQQKLVSGVGLICVLSAAVNWYGYTHHKIWRLTYGVNMYMVFKWLLEAVMLVALVWIIRRPGPEAPADEAGSPEAAVPQT